MKNALLIFLMLVLPWQAIAAMESNFAHLLDSAKVIVIKHIVDDANHALYHHDGGANGDGSHGDNSQKSAQNLADYDHHCNMTVLLTASNKPGVALASGIPPAVWPDIFANRTIIPLLRPPRTPA